MKIIKIIISVLFISLFSYTFSYAADCSKYDKLSKDYAKCTSDKLKKETSYFTKYFDNYRNYLKKNTLNSLLKGVIKLNF